METIFTWVIVFTALAFLLSSVWKKRKRNVGVGVVLARKSLDGTVWVSSRLLESPSGRAAVQLYERVVSINGTSMIFDNDKAFEEWQQEHPSVLGKSEAWRFASGVTLYLTPEVIREKIPVYWNPNEEEKPNLTHNGLVRPGLEWCNKTGQYKRGGRVSNEALKNVFFGE